MKINQNYYDVKAISQSQIKDFLNSKYTFWKNTSFNPDAETKVSDCLIFGSYYHSLILENKSVKKIYEMSDAFLSRTTQKYTKAQEQSKKTLITEKEYDLAKVMKKRLFTSLKELNIELTGEAEKEFYFEFLPANNLKFIDQAKIQPNGKYGKAKLDLIDHKNKIIYDLKTSKSIDIDPQTRFTYSLQATFYSWLIYQYTGKKYEFITIVQSKDPKEFHDILIDSYQNDLYEQNMTYIQLAIDGIQNAIKYPEILKHPTVEVVNIPQWIYNKLDKKLGIETTI